MKKILLVDGHSIANRAFYGLPPMSNSKGTPTNAIYGFINIFSRTAENWKADEVAVAFDEHAPTFRHEMFADYKGTRKAMPDDLRTQIPLIREWLETAGIPVISHAGLEADDILGTLSRRCSEDAQVYILSGDRDLLQLVNDRVQVLLPSTSKGGTETILYDEAMVKEKMGVGPQEYLQCKALMGDSSDNIPGVPSIGQKTAVNIISQYHTVESAIEAASQDLLKPKAACNKLKEHADLARLSLTLATIKTDADFPERPAAFSLSQLGTPKVIELYKVYEFKSLLSRFLKLAAREEEENSLQGFQVMESISENPFAQAELSSAETEFVALEGENQENPFAKETLDCECPQVSEKLQILEKEEQWTEMLEQLKNGFSYRIYQEEDGLFSFWAMAVCSDLGAWWMEDSNPFPKEMILSRLKPLLEDPQIPFSGHDVKQDLIELSSLDIEMKGLRMDTLIGAYLLNPLKEECEVDEISQIFLDEMAPSSEEIFGSGKNKKKWGAFTLQERSLIGGRQVRILQRAVPVIEKQLKDRDMEQLYLEIEKPLIDVLSSMEKTGIRVDTKVLREYGETLRVDIEKLQQTIWEEAGEEFNIQSPKQLGVILFEKMGLPPEKKTKSGYSTSAEILEKLAPTSSIVRNILQYRQLSKLRSTYVEGMMPFIRPDGKIHCHFNQTVAATGRLSSSDPNLQNIPIRTSLGRLLRKAFVPTDENWTFIDADYSQIELRLLAHMSGDENMIRAYQDGKDIHRITASQVLGKSPEEVTAEERSGAKAVSFGIIYGISAFSLSGDLGISQAEAKAYMQRYYKQFPSVEGFLNQCISDAKEKGYAVTLFGRRRPMDELKATNFVQRSFGERVARNMPIQGTAADIMKIAMVRVGRRLKEEGLMSRILITVHDELLIETRKGEEEKVKTILEEEMMGAADLRVPLEISMAEGSNWYEAK